VAKRKHQPPAKIRYNQTHPTVSIRVSKDLYDLLKELREKSGKSLGDILREALGKQAPTAQKAFDRGYAKARETFQVTYACSVCGKLMQVTSADEKQAIAGYMRENGWHHVNCPNK
jgi:predicted transcriptional regulator